MSQKRKVVAAGVFTLAVVGGVLMSAGWSIGLPSGDVDPGKHSAFTRSELETNWTGADEFPLLVPGRLPPGAKSAPEIGFSLDNVVAEDLRDPARRVWLSTYESDVLGEEGATFRVFQRTGKTSSESVCGSGPVQQSIERHIESTTVVICSPELTDGSAARNYWETVPLMSDLTKVRWLRD